MLSLCQDHFSQLRVNSILPSFFDVIQKRKSALVSVVFTLIDHKNDTMKCSKLGEQSTFLLLWARIQWTICIPLGFYRFVLFWLILKYRVWFDTLKCHRYMKGNLICDSAKAHNRFCCWDLKVGLLTYIYWFIPFTFKCNKTMIRQKCVNHLCS